eukprot:COSAG02_NODE_36271_length_457_cov_0.391061_1_plen_39_part_01
MAAMETINKERNYGTGSTTGRILFEYYNSSDLAAERWCL